MYFQISSRLSRSRSRILTGWTKSQRKQLLKRLNFCPYEAEKFIHEHGQASEIRVKVGYPLSPDTRDPKAIARYYDEVHVDRYNFFENILQAE